METKTETKTSNLPDDMSVMFGGQGYAYLEEIRASAAGDDESLATQLVKQTLEALGNEERVVEQAGIRIFTRFPFSSGWVLSPQAPNPPFATMMSSPFSFPLILVAQLANYATFLDRTKAKHEDVLPRIKAGSGHSQGIMASVVLSVSKTTEELLSNACLFARCLLWLGLRCHVPGSLVTEESSVMHSSMLSVSGMTPNEVEALISKTLKTVRVQHEMARSNDKSKTDEPFLSETMALSLINGRKSSVVSGDHSMLQRLKDDIARISVEGGSQSRVPFSERKPEARCTFLAISAPFHCTLNTNVVDKIMDDWTSVLDGHQLNELAFPILSTMDGSLLAQKVDLRLVIELQCIHPVNWPKLSNAISSYAPTIFEFGPSSGAAKMLADEKEGSGLLVVTSRSTKSKVASNRGAISDLESYLDLLTKGEKPSGPNWGEEFKPTLVQIKSKSGDKTLTVNTKFTRMLGRPPLIMAGMTPTTSFHGVDLVAACAQAGYLGELAAGGLVLPEYFQSKVMELAEKAPAGAGIAVNLLYLNAHLWSFQFPLVIELARAGVPIESVTVAAGVPTREKASEILSQLHQCGCRLVSFKPGTAQAIRDCLSIAEEAKELNMLVGIQWTGGRGGGHHSFEDFHEPLLETYSAIRQYSNVLLLVGSGFGDAQGSLPYLTGEWSEAFNRPRMPCDAVLIGSRCMVAKEAATARAVKELIVATEGVVNELEWEKSYSTAGAGGVITLTSELGEPIHKLDNRGMKCWRDFDKEFFSIPKGSPERLQRILASKPKIITRLNADFQKVYFGVRRDDFGNRIPADLEQMTYVEVLERMVELMFIENGETPRFPKRRWIDVSYQTRTFIFLTRAERRFRRDFNTPAVADDVTKLREFPKDIIQKFVETYPAARTTLLADDDVSFFVTLCRESRFGKPVNFIPVIDGDLDFWLKKDSLWYSEDLDAVPNRDPQRVCVLQGPVAVRHSTIVDEPIADIFDGIHSGWVKLLQNNKKEPLANDMLLIEGLKTLDESASKEAEKAFPFLKDLPPHAWQRLVLMPGTKIVRGRHWATNSIAAVLTVALSEGVSVTCTRDAIVAKQNVLVERLSENEISLKVAVSDTSKPGVLETVYSFQPNVALAPLVEKSVHTRGMYKTIWLREELRGKTFSVHDVLTNQFRVDENQVQFFNEAIFRLDPLSDLPMTSPSVDFSIVCGWEPLIRTLFAKEIEGDLLKLVHLSHGFRMLAKRDLDSRQLRIGDVVSSRVRVQAVDIVKGVGKKTSCLATLTRGRNDSPDGEQLPWMEISSSFLIRGQFEDYSSCFTSGPVRGEEEIWLKMESDVDCAVLTSKSWLDFVAPFSSASIKPGDRLLFVLESVFEQRASETELAEVRVRGNVFSEGDRGKVMGIISYQSNKPVKENPVLSFLRRKRAGGQGDEIQGGKMIESGGATLLATPDVIKVPNDPTKFVYGRASGDINPIHSSRYLAAMAELPEARPIVHGMWSFAVVRQVIERGVAQGNPSLIYKVEADFVGMVRFGEQLACQLTMLGVVAGRKLVRAELRSVARNELVLRAKAEVEQPKTAYLFTGQGSASVGMGMDRYEEVNSVRKVWDRADAHLLSKYGFSLLKIVRENPKELTVHFGGPSGRRIRENYRGIRVTPSGQDEPVQLLPEIAPDTKSFTFRSGGEGLLFATQFAQPALVVVQKAAFQELLENGMVPTHASFAGHSLGEYAGLAAFADVLSIEDLVETVFLRGMVMQNAVKRDAKGRSEFAMVAVNPSRVKINSKTAARFKAEDLFSLVDVLSNATGELLQVVNFNVRGSQYVVAGHLVALDVLEQCLSSGDPMNTVAVAIERSRKRFHLCRENDVAFELVRGTATIPLPGIDVPFHSKQLLPGVPSFRELLEPRLPLDRVGRVLDRLVGKYIPNVTAKFFNVDLDYVELSAQATGSKALHDLAATLKSPETSGKLNNAVIARTLLIELLAHQFAMPVLWIDTQDLIFRDGTRRVIEMGPAPTLVGMAQKTLETIVQAGVREAKSVEVLWWGRDMGTITYASLENKGPALDVFVSNLQKEIEEAARTESEASEEKESDTVKANESAPRAPSPPSPPAAAAAPAPPPVARAPVASGGAVIDQPISAKHTLKVLLASKLKKPLSEVSDSASLKSLTQGKSAVQNELVGDIAAEFNLSQDGLSPEMPLADLTAKASLGYKQLGKVSTQMVSRTLAAKLPGTYPASAARTYLTTTRNLSPQVAESVLLHGCGCMAPAARLADKSAAQQWLDQSVEAYASDTGLSLSSASSGGDMGEVDYANDFVEDVGGSGGGDAIRDAPLSTAHVLQCIVAAKLKVPLTDVRLDASLKSLSQGKSAVQNEILGDLQAEFPGVDWSSSAESPLKDVAAKIGGTVKQLGKISSQLVSRTLAAKLPGAFPISAARDFLTASKRLGPSAVEGVLLHSVTMAPSGRLNGADDAKAWLEQCVDAYAKATGLDLSSRGSGGSGGGRRRGGGGVAVSSKALEEHEKRLADMFQAQADVLNAYLSRNGKTASSSSSSAVEVTEGDAVLIHAREELGDAFLEGIRPLHDARKVREYDSYWNWVIQDALDMHLHVLATLRRERGEDVIIPHENNQHFKAMAKWIACAASGRMDQAPPQAWFRNFLCNRATRELLTAVEYFAQNMFVKGQPEYAQIISLLAEQVEAWVDLPPVLVARANHDAPRTTITVQGKIEYSEVPREGVPDCAKYVEALAGGAVYSKDDVTFDPTSVPPPSQSVLLDRQDVPLTAQGEEEEEVFHDAVEGGAASSSSDGGASSPESLVPTLLSPRSAANRTVQRPQGPILTAMRDTVVRHGADVSLTLEKPPLVHLRTAQPGKAREYDRVKTAQFLSCMHALATRGVSFAGQVVLVTGAGAGSIAIELVKLLLEGGAVVVSALNYAKSDEAIQETIKLYRRIYEEHGSKGSKLITQPINAGSSQDVTRLISHIYDDLGLDLDFIVPFAALPERGRDISRIDSESELAHRAMLTNVIRLLGAVRDAKQRRGITTRPAMVLIPCSPNHGVFGGDGLYAESKLGLEALVDKWRSEGWQDYLSLAACVIGWTRSALMWQNNVVAEGVEELGCRTFSTTEMAVNLVTLMHPRMVTLSSDEPLWADLTGGWENIPNLDRAVKAIRESIQNKATAMQALNRERTREQEILTIPGSSSANKSDMDRALLRKADVPGPDVPLANFMGEFPPLPSSYDKLAGFGLTGMVDLEKVVCVVGYGEVGPWGSARTRWEMEAYGHFSLEGCVELAWIVGLIQHHDGPLATNPKVRYVGWIDTKTKEPVMDHEVKRRYEQTILAHSGVRIIEPELFEGYTPSQKMVWTKVGFDKDLPLIEAASVEQALEIQKAAGGPDKCEVIVQPDGSGAKLRLRSGAVLAVPRAFQFNRFVAGQIPNGWSAERLGVPPEIARAVDPVTLYALVSTMEAFIAAGVCDPYEFYQYVHVTQVGNTSGGGMGGMRSLKRMFVDRALDDPEVPSDTLAESFINTMPAWVNMLLLSSSGPIKTPVGACATAAESADIGVETILSGKARVVICGGFDDFGEVGSFEFAQMGATQDNEKDRAKGRRPDEASRPMTSSRSGFVESHGAGMQVLMDAKLAIEMGCPIYGIVALTNTATDKEGRSIPAPGKGILTTARQVKPKDEQASPASSIALDLMWRRKEIEREMAQIDQWERDRLNVESMERAPLIRSFAAKKRSSVWETWGQGFYKNLSPEISPLSGALGVWGLTVDDIGVVSCHGTSTLLNDKNESSVIQKQFEHLGRSPGNICLVVAQKWLTAHPKGAAAAWMLNGALQTISTGLVPGNRNLDNCASELRQFNYLFYPNRSVQLPAVEAVLLKSFGFGQAGAEILLVHPNRLLATLDETTFESYVAKRNKRQTGAYRYWQGVLSGKHGLIRVKTRAPYLPEQETEVYLDPNARAAYDPKLQTWVFPKDDASVMLRQVESTPYKATATAMEHSSRSAEGPKAQVPAETRLQIMMQEQAEGLSTRGLQGSASGVGVDVEPVSTFAEYASKKEFISRNFTPREIEYCTGTTDPAASFAGRWAAKEAAIKALSNASPSARPLWEGAHASLLDVEVVHAASGAPVVELHGHAAKVALALGVGELKISISHTGDVAVAQALALTQKPN